MPVRFARRGTFALASAATCLLTLAGAVHATPNLGAVCSGCHSGDAVVTSTMKRLGWLIAHATLGSMSSGRLPSFSNTSSSGLKP